MKKWIQTNLELPSRYRPIQEISGGGMGDVLVCKDCHLERQVVVKCLQKGIDKSRIIDEIHALQKISSGHVVKIFDIVVSSKNKIAIIEEYINGNDLSEIYLPLGTSDYLRTLWQIAFGIPDIHQCGVIHRDIKPNNIKVDQEGISKIFDFGLARPFGTKASTRGFKGTLGFAAPELFKSGLVMFSTAADVYAFGVLAAFLATGEVPTKFCSMPPQRVDDFLLREYVQNLPVEVADLLESCWSFHPNERPQMASVRDAIARHMLLWRHRALLVLENQSWVIDKANSKVNISTEGVASMAIEYDGLEFVARRISGAVFVNNQPIVSGYIFPGSCVITLGGSTARIFATFDISYPEVVL